MAEPPAYVEIPPYASILRHDDAHSPLHSRPSSPSTPLGKSTNTLSLDSTVGSPTGPGRFNISGMLFNQALQALPTPANGQVRQPEGQTSTLVSARDPLSIPIMSNNFRRFIGKCGVIFWMQDRVDEVIMWRKGNLYTAAWMAAYAFCCYYPRMALLIPHIALLHILFSTYQARYPDHAKEDSSAPPPEEPSIVQATEGTPDWFANMQAIQNLMGIVSDADDFVRPHLVHLSWNTPTTQPIFVATLVSFFVLIPILYFAPLRILFLVLGLTPFCITHPYTLSVLPALVKLFTPYVKAAVQKLVNDDRLRDEHWRTRLIPVSVWENQKWTNSAWGASSGEKQAWTLGEESWSVVTKGDIGTGSESTIRDLVFPLPSGWKFVGTEDWSIDFLGHGQNVLPDEDGWIYTDSAWGDPQSQPLDEWKTAGMTRRRKWVRRIYRPKA